MVGLAATRELVEDDKGVIIRSRLPGSESARHGEEDDFLVCPFFAGIVFLGAAAGGRVVVRNGCPSVMSIISPCTFRSSNGNTVHILELDALRQRITDFERCHCD